MFLCNNNFYETYWNERLRLSSVPQSYKIIMASGIQWYNVNYLLLKNYVHIKHFYEILYYWYMVCMMCSMNEKFSIKRNVVFLLMFFLFFIFKYKLYFFFVFQYIAVPFIFSSKHKFPQRDLVQRFIFGFNDRVCLNFQHFEFLLKLNRSFNSFLKLFLSVSNFH